MSLFISRVQIALIWTVMCLVASSCVVVPTSREDTEDASPSDDEIVGVPSDGDLVVEVTTGEIAGAKIVAPAGAHVAMAPLTVDVGVAPVRPAEFVTFRISQEIETGTDNA